MGGRGKSGRWFFNVSVMWLCEWKDTHLISYRNPCRGTIGRDILRMHPNLWKKMCFILFLEELCIHRVQRTHLYSQSTWEQEILSFSTRFLKTPKHSLIKAVHLAYNLTRLCVVSCIHSVEVESWEMWGLCLCLSFHRPFSKLRGFV